MVTGRTRVRAIRHTSRSRHDRYDFVVKVPFDGGYEYQVAGHLETGDDSISDPAMGGLL